MPAVLCKVQCFPLCIPENKDESSQLGVGPCVNFLFGLGAVLLADGGPAEVQKGYSLLGDRGLWASSGGD